MKLGIVEVEYDLSPVEVRENGLQSLDKHSDVPSRRGFTSKVGRITSHTLHSVCVCMCVCT